MSSVNFRQWLREQQGHTEPPRLSAGDALDALDATLRDVKKFMQVDPAKLKPHQFQAAQVDVEKRADELEKIVVSLRQRWHLKD